VEVVVREERRVAFTENTSTTPSKGQSRRAPQEYGDDSKVEQSSGLPAEYCGSDVQGVVERKLSVGQNTADRSSCSGDDDESDFLMIPDFCGVLDAFCSPLVYYTES
jgi:hypothetical protein